MKHLKEASILKWVAISQHIAIPYNSSATIERKKYARNLNRVFIVEEHSICKHLLFRCHSPSTISIHLRTTRECVWRFQNFHKGGSAYPPSHVTSRILTHATRLGNTQYSLLVCTSRLTYHCHFRGWQKEQFS